MNMYIIWVMLELSVLCLLILGYFYNIYYVFTGKSKDKGEFIFRMIGIPLFPIGMLFGLFTWCDSQ